MGEASSPEFGNNYCTELLSVSRDQTVILAFKTYPSCISVQGYAWRKRRWVSSDKCGVESGSDRLKVNVDLQKRIGERGVGPNRAMRWRGVTNFKCSILFFFLPLIAFLLSVPRIRQRSTDE